MIFELNEMIFGMLSTWSNFVKKVAAGIEGQQVQKHELSRESAVWFNISTNTQHKKTSGTVFQVPDRIIQHKHQQKVKLIS